MSAFVYLGACLLVLGMLGMLAGYLHPATRPIVRKWWWLGLVVLAGISGAVLAAVAGGTRKPPGQASPRADSAASAKAIVGLGNEALARAAAADADLARKRLEARALDTNGAAVVAFDDAAAKARAIPDPVARRAALVALVERAR